MKMPNRAVKCLELLDEIEYTVDYYTGGSRVHKSDFQILRQYIEEISKSKRLSDIQVAEKVKKELKS